MIGRRPARRWTGPGRGARRAALLAAVLVASGVAAGAAEDPAAELTHALASLGAPGLLWGRLAVEEESPEGSWTPLAGIDVAAFPYAPGLAADLDRIRERARASGADYDAAVSRLKERLAAWEGQARTVTGGPTPAGSVVRRQTTDPAGIFVFPDLPSGEWLLVALHVSPYHQATDGARARGPARRGKGGSFLPQSSTPAQEAEVWVVRVRLAPGERARVMLTDRGRFMVGPVR